MPINIPRVMAIEAAKNLFPGIFLIPRLICWKYPGQYHLCRANNSLKKKNNKRQKNDKIIKEIIAVEARKKSKLIFTAALLALNCNISNWIIVAADPYNSEVIGQLCLPMGIQNNVYIPLPKSIPVYPLFPPFPGPDRKTGLPSIFRNAGGLHGKAL